MFGLEVGDTASGPLGPTQRRSSACQPTPVLPAHLPHFLASSLRERRERSLRQLVTATAFPLSMM